jgi:drug/metabolite transporter (DMT)-like permease
MGRDLPQTETGHAATLAGRLGILLTVALWGSQYPLTHDLAQRWDAYTIIAGRYPIGAALVLGIAALITDPGRRRPAEPVTFARAAALGAAMAAFALAFTVGLAIGDPVTCAIVAAMAPVNAALVTWATEGQAPQRSLFLPLALAVPGAVLASVRFSGGPAEGHAIAGALMILSAQVCWAWYSIKAQRWLRGRSQTMITGLSFLWCCPYAFAAWILAALAGATHADWQSEPVRDAALFALLTFGALVLGVLLWNVAVSALGVTLSSLHLNLIPVVAILTGYALGIAPRPEQIAGALLVIVGVLIAQRPAFLFGRRSSP